MDKLVLRLDRNRTCVGCDHGSVCQIRQRVFASFDGFSGILDGGTLNQPAKVTSVFYVLASSCTKFREIEP